MRPTPAIRPGRIGPLILLVVAGGALGSCDGSPTGNGVRRVELWMPYTQLRPGDQVQAYAAPLDAAGEVVEGVGVRWRSLTPATLSVTPYGLVTGVAPGVGVVRASVGSVSGSWTLTLVNPPIAAISVSPDTLRLSLPGGTATVVAAPRDSEGLPIFGEPLAWVSSAARIASVNGAGEVRAVAVGVATITVSAQGIAREVVVVVDAPATATSPVIASVAPGLAVPGATLVVTGTGFSGSVSQNAVLIDGVPVSVTSATTTQLLVTLPAASAFPCELTREVALQVTSPGGIGTSPVTLRVAAQRALAAGQSLTFSSLADARCHEFDPAPGRYVITLPNGGRALGAATMALSVRGAATVSAGAGGTAALAAASARNAEVIGEDARRVARRGTPGLARPRPLDARFRARAAGHARILEANRSRPRPPLGAQVRVPSQAAALESGTFVNLRFPALGQGNFCSSFASFGARVVYAGAHVTILEDSVPVFGGAPTLAGQLDAVYAEVGAELDAVAWPILQQFGDPLVSDSRLDADGRVRIVLTPRMNEVLGGGVLAAVVTCDFYSRAQFPSSNVGEYVYAQVPTILGNGAAAGTVERWRHEMRATLVHELKHVTSYAERIVRGQPLEEAWLEEATARHAEELLARALFGAVRGGDHGADVSLRCELLAFDPSAPECAGTPRALRSHVEGLWAFLDATAARSPLGSVSDPADFSYYGSGWALTRWLLDQEGLAEPGFFTALTTSGQSGVTNLQGRSGRDWDEILPEWSLAMLTDGGTPVPPASARLTFPSWDLTALFGAMCQYAGDCGPLALESPWTRPHPWQPVRLEAGGFLLEQPVVVPGGFAAFELVVTTPGTRQLIEVLGYRGGSLPASARMGILRIE